MQLPDQFQPRSYQDFLKHFSLEIPENFNFAYDFLDVEAAKDPKRPAMLHVDPAGVRRDYDLAFFSRESSRLANALEAAGLKRGDVVLLVLQRRVEFWIYVLALLKIGAVPSPSPHLLTAHDVEFRVNKASAACFVCEDGFTERVLGIVDKLPTLKLCVQVGDNPAPAGFTAHQNLVDGVSPHRPKPDHAPGGKDQAFIFFSSGTTGMPKMVAHTHEYPLGHFTTGVHWHNLEPGDVHLTLADTGWAKSMWGKFFGQWFAKAVVMVWDYRGKFEPADLLDILAKHKATSFCAPPTVYRLLVREDLAQFDLAHLKHCTTAGELLNDGVFHAWKKALGIPIYEGYGQTETCLLIGTFPFMEPKPGSIGKPAPGWNIVLENLDGKPCEIGEEGEIRVVLEEGQNLGLFTGYHLEPERTADAIHHGKLHTGDKAWLDEDGYYWFLGRNDDLIKSSGYRIGPFEVESALITHPAVVEAAVTAVPDPVRGQAVKATLVLAKGFSPSDELVKEIQNHVKKVTAPYKYPRIVEFVPELPKTISGKIKRAEIRQKDAG